MYRDAAVATCAAPAELAVSSCVFLQNRTCASRAGNEDEREDVMVEKHGEQIVQTAREARQAERGPSMRNVLMISTSAVIVALAIVYVVFFMA